MSGSAVFDSEGHYLGTISAVLVDDDTGDPVFVVVELGLLGGRRAFAPLRGAGVTLGRVRLAATRRQVHDAPSFDHDHPLDEDDERRLRDHYASP